MRVNRDSKTYKPPYKVVLMDALEAYYYADMYDDSRMILYATLDELYKAKALADALFVVKNYRWESLEAMNEDDSGWDVRVLDVNNATVYAAHVRFKKKWIGK